MKKKTGTLDYIIRIIYLLPVLILAVLESVKKLIKFVIDYVRYGGEMIVYCKQNSRTTILDCFEKLREIQNEQEKVEKTCGTCKHMEYGVVKLICKTCQIRSCWEPRFCMDWRHEFKFGLLKHISDDLNEERLDWENFDQTKCELFYDHEDNEVRIGDAAYSHGQSMIFTEEAAAKAKNIIPAEFIKLF